MEITGSAKAMVVDVRSAATPSPVRTNMLFIECPSRRVEPLRRSSNHLRSYSEFRVRKRHKCSGPSIRRKCVISATSPTNENPGTFAPGSTIRSFCRGLLERSEELAEIIDALVVEPHLALAIAGADDDHFGADLRA